MSILRAIEPLVVAESDLDKSKEIIINFLSEQQQSKDIRLMLVQVKHQIFSKPKLNQWLYNAILKFEGLGVVGSKYTK